MFSKASDFINLTVLLFQLKNSATNTQANSISSISKFEVKSDLKSIQKIRNLKQKTSRSEINEINQEMIEQKI